MRAPRSTFLLLALALAGGCSRGGGGGVPGPTPFGQALRLVSVEQGLLADVYGLYATAGGTAVELYRSDVLVGPDIADERPSGSAVPDESILYDFLSADPATLQPRLLITRAIGSAEFAAAYEHLDDHLRLVQPGVFGQKTQQQPFSVVARNAALRLTFNQDLGIDDDFFVQRDPSGRVVGFRNTEAVQLLEITGDPNGQGPGRFAPVVARLVPRDRQIVIDPVLLGGEGLQYGTPNNAAGLPESPDQVGANMRLALALDGPLAIPGLRPDRSGSGTGQNNSGRQAVIRDFRSGNRDDNGPDLSRGFLRDPVPPVLVGELPFYLEKVEPRNASTQFVTLYKNHISHEIDRGDTLRLFADNSGVPAAVTEVVLDPLEDAGQPAVQHVRAVVRRVLHTNAQGQVEDVLEQLDPSNLAGYPGSAAERETWLPANAPPAVLVAEFTGSRLDPTGKPYGDDPRYFVSFTPAPLVQPGEAPSQPGENVSPFASAVIRFNKPIDLATVRSLDTFFFATRDLLDDKAETAFRDQRGIDPQAFDHDKYVTPHLVAAQVFDADGSQTTLRLQPTLGFYLDQRMRDEDDKKPFAEKSYRYYVHLVGGAGGVRDLAGNALDFRSATKVLDHLAFPFSLDTRSNGARPLFPDNRVVSVARRLNGPDEDEQPSYYAPAEVQQAGAPFNAKASPLSDLFGAVVFLSDGTLAPRPPARVRRSIDDLNQVPPPPPGSPQQWCPTTINGVPQIPSATAAARFRQGLWNPLNPFGCRLQTLWRELDLGLSKTDPRDFDLDVERMFWAPFADQPIVFDEFDRTSLLLGHSERRPEACTDSTLALPSMRGSGLRATFADNYVFNYDLSGAVESQPPRHVGYLDKPVTILSTQAVTEVNGVYRYLPLPALEKPYFVWRDQRVLEQGGDSGNGCDTGISSQLAYTPYILSPFLGGRGRSVVALGGAPSIASGFWDNRDNWSFLRAKTESLTGGLLGSIALPLLVDIWTYPDDPTLPAGNPFRASGATGWQVSLGLTSGPKPNFRVYSAGGLTMTGTSSVDPTQKSWITAAGGLDPNGAPTRNGDNTVFWMMADFVKRTTVVTGGFVDVWDPHRMLVYPAADPRLGPYYDPAPGGSPAKPRNVVPRYAVVLDPPSASLPPGTSATVELRAAGPLDASPWFAPQITGNEPPDWLNVPLDPLKAGDAHIRKLDDRGPGAATWTHYYQRILTSYTGDAADLSDPDFTGQFAPPGATFEPGDVRYFNYRLVFVANVDASPPVVPRLDSLMVSYRLETR